MISIDLGKAYSKVLRETNTFGFRK